MCRDRAKMTTMGIDEVLSARLQLRDIVYPESYLFPP